MMTNETIKKKIQLKKKRTNNNTDTELEKFNVI